MDRDSYILDIAEHTPAASANNSPFAIPTSQEDTSLLLPQQRAFLSRRPSLSQSVPELSFTTPSLNSDDTVTMPPIVHFPDTTLTPSRNRIAHQEQNAAPARSSVSSYSNWPSPKAYEFDRPTTVVEHSEDDYEHNDELELLFRDTDANAASVPLVPFSNQVGGHTSFLRFSNRAVCKPMSRREKDFYEALERLHPDMMRFTASYLGVVNVSYTSQDELEEAQPEIVLAHNRHIIPEWLLARLEERMMPGESSLKKDKPAVGEGLGDSQNPGLSRVNRKLQQQIFQDALSPRSLRFRIKQVKSRRKAGLRRRHSADSETINLTTKMAAERSNSRNTESSMIPDDTGPAQPLKWSDQESPFVDPSAPTLASSSHTPTEAGLINGEDTALHKPVAIRPSIFLDTPENHNLKLSTSSPSACNIPINQLRLQDNDAVSVTSSIGSDVDRLDPAIYGPASHPNKFEGPARLRQFVNFDDKSISASDPPTSNAAASSYFPASEVEQDDRPIFQIDDVSNLTAAASSPSVAEKQVASEEALDSDLKLSPHKNLHRTASTPAGNPWSLHCYNSSLQRMRASPGGNSEETLHQFLLLEDLTEGLGAPCILDLKMGSRQHGVDATKAKRDSQMRKCIGTTSRTLGVRVCGMQVYKASKARFLFQDKYYGRSLTPRSFKSCLTDYLDNGERILIHYIAQVVERLKVLKRTVEQLDGWRFYASSLLLLYDGDLQANGPSDGGERKDLITLKIIDFAHCLVPDSSLPTSRRRGDTMTYPPSTNGPDHGYLLGLTNLIRFFEEIRTAVQENRDPREEWTTEDEESVRGGIKVAASEIATFANLDASYPTHPV